MHGDLPNRGAGANTLKGLIGLGVLNLPWATKQVGWLPSVIGMALVCAITVYGIFFAVRAREKLDRLHEVIEQADEDVEVLKSHGAGSASGAPRPAAPDERTPLRSGPQGSPDGSGASSRTLHRGCGLGCFDPVVHEVLGMPGLALWASCILFCQVGTGIAYITVIVKGAEDFGMSHAHAFCFVGLLLIGLSAVKQLRGIAYFSCGGLLVYLFVLMGIFYESGRLGMEGKLGASAHMISHAASGSDVMAWFGIASFAFGALPVSLSVYDEMNKPQDFYKVTGIAYTFCWAIYSVVAVLGYLCYGADTESIIFFNFAQGSIWRVGSIMLISVILILTYVVQMVPVFNFAQSFVGQSVHWMVIRTAIVAFTMVMAHAIPSTVTLVAVVGTFAAALGCFVLPPLVYINIAPPPSVLESLMCCSLIALGMLVAIETLFV